MPSRSEQRDSRAGDVEAARRMMPGVRFPIIRSPTRRLRDTPPEPHSGSIAQPPHTPEAQPGPAGAPAITRNDAHERAIPRSRPASALKCSASSLAGAMRENSKRNLDRAGMHRGEKGIFRTCPIWERSHLSQNCVVGSAHRVADHIQRYSAIARHRAAPSSSGSIEPREQFSNNQTFSAPGGARGSASQANAY
ncbi:hypothetical protein Y603_5135 [Burkholderia pseudomallei MSHR1153]|nr:hypothetical protein Y603_5135 [Burkholderia pseudomallei MSHR1153]